MQAAVSAAATFDTVLSGLSLSSGALVPAFDPTVTDYTATSLTSLVPVQVTATTASASASIAIDGMAATSGVPATLTLAPRQDIVVTVRGSDDVKRDYVIHYVPPDLPNWSVWSDGRGGSEKVLLTPANKYLLAVDRGGAPVYYRSFAPEAASDFERHRLPSGELVYTALSGTGYTAWTLGTTHVFDATFREIAQVQLLPNRGHGALPSEAHDFVVLGDEHYLAMSYVQRTVDLHDLADGWSDAAPVMHGVVQEIDHGSVVFEWDSADVPSLYADSTDGNGFTSNTVSDYLHLNSIAVDPRDSNFVFSLRHTNSIVKVDRKSGKILWTLGGREDQFGLTLGQYFFHQHHVRVQDDGSLLVFDNGNGAHQTRVVSLVLDEAKHHVLDFQVVAEKPMDQPQSLFMGSATRFGSSRELIGWGGWSEIPAQAPPSVTELVDGTPSWTLTFASPNVYSYRALPID